MTTKILTGTYASGYTITLPVTVLTVATTGYVEGNGILSPAAGHGAYTIVNDGKIKASGFGVYLYSGGSVTNGATSVKTAQISGGIGVIVGFAAGTVANFGTIQGTGVSTGGALGNGVILSQGGTVTNGAASDPTALIAGAAAVAVYGRAGTIRNFGTLAGTASPPDGRVVYLDAGGSITNGSASDTVAFIGGAYGQFYIDPIVAKNAPATVTNFGSIVGGSSYTYNHVTDRLNIYLSTAINLEAGGKVTNGTTTDTTAYISGTYGIVIGAGRGTVTNDGSIASYFYTSLYVPPTDYQQGYTNTYVHGIGVTLGDGGLFTNGAASDTKASVFAAQYGVEVKTAAGTVRNYGTMFARGVANAAAVDLTAGGNVTNGGVTDAVALLKGAVGVRLTGAGTVINYGSIVGYAASVEFSSSADTLVVEPGCLFSGNAAGAGGTLVLASSIGSIAQIELGSVSFQSGAPEENFIDFGTLEVASGSAITLDGDGVTQSGGTSTLDLLGTLIVTGSLATGGKVLGAGTLSLEGGQTTFGASTSLTVAHITESGAATMAIAAATLAYAGNWDQTGGTVSVNAGDRLTFDGAGDSFSGTLAGAGTVAFTGGSDTFAGVTLLVKAQTISAATVTLSGAITLGSTLTTTTPNLIVAAAGATLTGGGTLFLTDNAANSVHGATSTATLTNASDKILGAGLLGGGEMRLVNDATGVIDGDYAAGLIIDTGVRGIINVGLIEATGAGLVTIKSAIENLGTLYAAGDLTVNGAVTGAGTVKVGGGIADFTSTFVQNVAFTAAGGTLELAKSQSYTGQISGFSKVTKSSLDLGDIAFGGGTKATYSGTTTSGVLTVTDGTHSANIHFTGNYLSSTWVVSAGPGGGTKIVDSAGTAASPLAQAMAGFEPSSGGSAAIAPQITAPPTPLALTLAPGG